MPSDILVLACALAVSRMDSSAILLATSSRRRALFPHLPQGDESLPVASVCVSMQSLPSLQSSSQALLSSNLLPTSERLVPIAKVKPATAKSGWDRFTTYMGTSHVVVAASTRTVPTGLRRRLLTASTPIAKEPSNPVSTFGLMVTLRSADETATSMVGYGGCSSRLKLQHFPTRNSEPTCLDV